MFNFNSFIRLVGLLGGCFSPLSAAIFHHIDTTSPLLCAFSSKYQNRVMVENGRVQKVIATDEGRLSIFMEEISGQAFICARDLNPEDMTISIITDLGTVQDLQVTFIESLPEVIILKEKLELQEEKQEEIQEQAAESDVIAKVGDLLIGHVPQGYIVSQIKCTPWKLKQGIILQPLSRLEGPHEILNLYRVINTSSKKKTLNECELQTQGCRWVFLQTNAILPKQKVFAVISVDK